MTSNQIASLFLERSENKAVWIGAIWITAKQATWLKGQYDREFTKNLANARQRGETWVSSSQLSKSDSRHAKGLWFNAQGEQLGTWELTISGKNGAGLIRTTTMEEIKLFELNLKLEAENRQKTLQQIREDDMWYHYEYSMVDSDWPALYYAAKS